MDGWMDGWMDGYAPTEFFYYKISIANININVITLYVWVFLNVYKYHDRERLLWSRCSVLAFSTRPKPSDF